MMKSLRLVSIGAVISTATLASTASAVVCDDVYPHLSFGIGYDETKCLASGGCWETAGCYFPKVPGYSFAETERSKGVVKGNLTLIEATGALGPDYKNLNLEITQETKSRTRVLITPTGVDAWQVPESIIKRPGGVYTGLGASEIILSPKDPFQMSIKSGKDTLFTMSKMLIFQEQYVQVVLSTPSNVRATYGFGESTRSAQALKKGKQYTLWNTDYWAGGFDASLYGTHPFFIQVTEDGNAHGVLFLNSNAMEVMLDDSDTLGSVLAIQAAGGVVDFYVFSGPSPADVIKQYQEVIGKPAMVPYWSLGFHNCRWGYENLQQIKDVVANYSAAGIPLETQWADIDYMQNYLDFTTDAVDFPTEAMKTFVDTLHANDQHFVPIVDPGIYAVPNDASPYPALVEGLEQNVFITDLNGQEPYLGQVWPGPTYFPDWFATNTTSYWQSQLQAFHDKVPYDGIWIDMNEVSNFCNAYGTYQVCELDPDSTCPDGCCLSCSTVDPTNKYDFPPYTPHVAQGSLSGKTVAMSTLHAGGIREYNVHPFYGLMESIATNKAVTNIRNERAFVLSRSTYLSSGVYTAHWTGDNAATWEDLAASIITMNNLALFGISMTGADICGFAYDTTEELCSRWIEVGAFSPFSRDHNTLDAAPQELYLWDTVTRSAINALNMRYQLLPYLYTLMSSANLFGNTVMNALWMHFPADSVASGIDSQYMWSNGVLFTPVLTEGAVSVKGYFPQGVWYPLFESDTHGTIDASAAGLHVELDTPLESTNAHIRGGSVIPMQGAAMTTAAAKKTPFTLVVALDEKKQAEGQLFLDNGVQRDLNDYVLMKYSAANSVLTSAVDVLKGSEKMEYIHSGATLNKIRVLDHTLTSSHVCKAQLEVQTVSAKGVTSAVSTHALAASVDAKHSALEVSVAELGLSVASHFSVTWSCA